ncbi:MAG: flagellar hook-length control protein FliK [Hoeflea sp.]|uniref:flagellar hook-length control protein FliK n=1 Tax=Hoeflea sp. TaxID=1940281 RepID=UPI003EF9BEC6
MSGLKSSAAYRDDAELGNLTNGEEVSLEVAIDEPRTLQTETRDGLVKADGEPVGSLDGSLERPDRTANAQPAVSDANAAALASAVPSAEASARPVVAERTGSIHGKQTAADKASNAITVAKSETVSQATDMRDAQATDIKGAQATDLKAAQATDLKAAQAPGDAKTTATPAQVASASSSLAGQSAQLQPRATAVSNGSDQQKEPSAVKEAMRALGVESASVLTKTDASKAQGRTSARQGGADDKSIDELTNKKDGKIEVIESRRFMPAQNLSANAQMLTRTLAEAGTNALAAQRAAPSQPLAQTALPQTGQTLHTLKLQLNPISLGSVTAVLKLSGEDLSVEIKVQTAEAYRQLKEDNQSILKALRAQGFGVEQITVQHVVGNERASNQAGQPGFQSSQQGPGSNDAQSFGKDGNRNSAGQQQSGSRGGQGNEQSSYAGSGVGRTDGVYL